MYFNFSSVDFKKADELLNIKERNISAAKFYIDYLSSDDFHTSKEEIEPFLKEYGLSDAIFHAIMDKMGIDFDDEHFIEVNKNSHLDKLVELDPNEYTSNPYFKLIKSIALEEKDWVFNTQYYKPFECFTSDELRINTEGYEEETPIGYFKERFDYPAVIEDETIWMSLIPHEINTMKEPIEKAKGNVLVFGLGLGYYAFMVSEKPSVNKVTIIEKDKNIINLFTKHILPLFPNKKKITIIHDDAYHYLDNLRDNYDYAFIDIYHNVGDGFPLYVRFKPYEKEFESTELMYWIETSMVAMLRRYVLTLYEEKIHYRFTDKDYKIAMDDNDRFINKLYFYLKDYEFNSYEEFHKFLSTESLKKLLINI